MICLLVLSYTGTYSMKRINDLCIALYRSSIRINKFVQPGVPLAVLSSNNIIQYYVDNYKLTLTEVSV